jgi:hypothetical protein
MRTVVIVFGSDARRSHAARATAAALSTEPISEKPSVPWADIVSRLALDEPTVAQADWSSSGELRVALPIVRSAAHLFQARVTALWAQGSDDDSIAECHALIAPLVDRFIALAEPAPPGVDVVTLSTLLEALDERPAIPAERAKNRTNGKARVAQLHERERDEHTASAIATLVRDLGSESPRVQAKSPDTAPRIQPSALDYSILSRLRELPSSRALHGIIVGVLSDASQPLGNLLRQNAVTALARAIAEEDAYLTWTIVPREAFADLGAGSETDAVIKLATMLQPHPFGEQVTSYLRNVAASFSSFAELDEEKARARLLAPSESLDSSFDSWFRGLRGD